jgi:hypothetical protein
MKIFSDFDVYSRKYTYDEMKVMCVITCICQDNDYTLLLDYEDVMRIVEAVYAYWINGIDNENLKTKYPQYSWLEFKDSEEAGYIQKYAERVLPEFIKLYLEEFKNG